MDRNDRGRYYQGGYGNEYRHDRDWNNRESRDLNNQFEREYRNSRGHGNDSDNFYRDSAYEHDYDNSRFRSDSRRDYNAGRRSDRDDFRNYRSRDYDMERNYYDNTRGDRGMLGDVRQGYGISGFGGTSDRYDTASEMQREQNAQFEQGYGTGRMSGYSGAAFGGANYSAKGDFGGSSHYGSMSGSGGNMDDYASSSGYGGGYGSSGVHSDRGVPNYSPRHFGDDYAIGASSTYGGRNYGGGTGYPSGNRGGAIGNNTYGSSSGNYGGSGSPDVSNYGRYAANADRGGYTNHDPNRDSGY